MKCKHCDAKLAIHDIWCSNCGHQTSLVNADLSAWKSLVTTWNKFNPFKGLNVPAAALIIVAGILPLILFVLLMRAFGFLDLIEIQNTGKLFLNLLVVSVGFIVIMPTLFIPFDPVSLEPGYSTTLKSILNSFRNYPKYLVLAVICVLYYVLIFLICFGLPNFGSDPILRLVWLVLVNYFPTLCLPVPVLMQRQNINAWKALKISYKYFHVVRWQMYLLVLVLALINALATMLVLIPLVITIPLTWYAIRDYTDLLLSNEMIRDKPKVSK